MAKILNRRNSLNILYLPNRILRFLAKEIKEISREELESKEFQKRKNDFLVVNEEKLESNEDSVDYILMEENGVGEEDKDFIQI